MKTISYVQLFRLAAMFCALLPALHVNATFIDSTQVYEAINFNDGAGQHALWTNKDFATDNTFSATALQLTVDTMGTAQVDDDVARLFGTATATGFDPDLVAHIDLLFTGARTSLDFTQHHYKQENGLAYNDLMANNPVFWTDVLGSIEIDGDIFDVDRHVVMDGKGFTFQFGLGANAKNPNEFGGSSWVQTCQRDAGVADADACMDSHHWDLNLALRPVSVPEPGTVALLLAGLVGLVTARRTAN